MTHLIFFEFSPLILTEIHSIEPNHSVPISLPVRFLYVTEAAR